MAKEPAKAGKPAINEEAQYEVKLTRPIEYAGLTFRPEEPGPRGNGPVRMSGSFLKMIQGDSKYEGVLDDYREITS